MQQVISSIRISEERISSKMRPGLLLAPPFSAADVYRQAEMNYPKFFKMDPLCRWAFVGAELLCGHGEEAVYTAHDKEKIAVVLATANGCLEVDKQYQESMQQIASPGLFVYTLPNIMLGEISIRHGFKGEQLCLVQESFDAAEMCFAVADLLCKRGMEACLCGWINLTGQKPDVRLWWVPAEAAGLLQPAS